jgi:hypothetical protein
LGSVKDMNQWEYKIVERTGRHGSDTETTLIDEITELGLEGWEAVGLGHGGNYRSTVILMKRMKL